MSAQKNLSPAQFYHGSGVKLNPGAVILPRNSTGVAPSYQSSSEDPRSDQYKEGSQSYLTTDPKMAVSFARDHSDGRVYQVNPTGPISADPEDTSGTMFMSASPLTVLRQTRYKVVPR